MKKIPEDIKQLDKKIEELRRKEAAVRRDKPKTDAGRASRIGFRIGVELLSAVIVGAALGYLADQLLGTRPWCLAVFLFFGGAAGILNVYRLAKQEDNHK